MNKQDVINYIVEEIERCRDEYAAIIAKQISEGRFYKTAAERNYDADTDECKNRDKEDEHLKRIENRIKKCQYDLYVLTHNHISMADFTTRRR